MRYFTPVPDTRCYAGVDLHARSLFLSILDRDGQARFGRNLPAASQPFLRAVAPFRDGLVVCCECLFCWYWLADLCAAEKIEFVLGHALYMKAIHGGKAKNDKIDAYKIASLLRGGNFPLAYVYPRQLRATCVFHPMPVADFTACRSPISRHAGRSFHMMPVAVEG